eukprot:8564085-Ditylum_brightwellii.AAC.1
MDNDDLSLENTIKKGKDVTLNNLLDDYGNMESYIHAMHKEGMTPIFVKNAIEAPGKMNYKKLEDD